MEVLEERRLLAVWDGGAGNSLWNDPVNWAGDQLPGASDSVLVNFHAIIPSSVSLANLELAEGGYLSGEGTLFASTVSWSTGIADVNIYTSSLYIGPNGKTRGVGNVTVSGSFDWNSGEIANKITVVGELATNTGLKSDKILSGTLGFGGLSYAYDDDDFSFAGEFLRCLAAT